jgi:hypothetical protein
MGNISNNMITPLELLNLYYSDGCSLGNREDKLWHKINALLSWDNILNKGYQADLCPLLYYIATKAFPRLNKQNLQQTLLERELLPDSILSHLKNEYNISFKRNLILLEELKQVVQKLKKNGIQVIVLKGAHLAEHIYENIACRPMVDIDILIRDSDRDKTYEILNGMGYSKILESIRTMSLHYSFTKQVMAEQIVIEVHHRLAKKTYMINFDLDELFMFDHMLMEYQLLYTAWHGIEHGMGRLIWLCDLMEIIRNSKQQIECETIKDKSVACNVKIQFSFCVHLLNSIFYHAIPLKELSKNIREKRSPAYRYYISKMLFHWIQKKRMEQKDGKILRNALYMHLMQGKKLIKYIPQYLQFRYLKES